MTDPNRFSALAAPGVRALRPYEPGKPESELGRELGISDIAKLASNENPLGPSPKAQAALAEALGTLHRYPDGGAFELKARLAAHHGVAPERITLGNGSNEVIELVIRTFVTPADSVVFAEHAFIVYKLAAQAHGVRGVEVKARDYGHDLAAMRAAVDATTRVVFIANPNNPTGTWLGAAELEAFIADLPAHVLVAIDEAYIEYAAEVPGFPDSAAWLDRYPNLIVMRTFSKAHALAGLRIGYALSHPDVANLMNRVRAPFNVNALAQVAACASLDDPGHIARGLENNRAGLARLTAACTGLGLGFIPSVGNFLTVDVGRPAGPVYQALLHEGVIVRPIAGYGLPNHLRITVGRPDQNERCIAALGKVLAG